VGRGAGRRQERARHKCFEVLLPELEEYGVTRAVFERRGARADRADLGKVAACRIKRLLVGKLSVGFDEPLREPLLWLADAVCGALFAEQAGDAPTPRSCETSSTRSTLTSTDCRRKRERRVPPPVGYPGATSSTSQGEAFLSCLAPDILSSRFQRALESANAGSHLRWAAPAPLPTPQQDGGSHILILSVRLTL
jgi:hypothetical protein